MPTTATWIPSWTTRSEEQIRELCVRLHKITIYSHRTGLNDFSTKNVNVSETVNSSIIMGQCFEIFGCLFT